MKTLITVTLGFLVVGIMLAFSNHAVASENFQRVFDKESGEFVFVSQNSEVYQRWLEENKQMCVELEEKLILE